MPTISQLLQLADQLDSHSARLDIELLLADVLGQNRAYLFTWPDKTLSSDQLSQFYRHFERRKSGEPIAYIIGRQGFWSLELDVNSATLIPRPETELVVETALQLFSSETHLRVLDLGTGTGAIALALAYEQPQWYIYGVDISASAIALAERNKLKSSLSNCCFYQGSWFDSLADHATLPSTYHLVVSNPPYIAAGDEHLQVGDIRYEPKQALIADADGLADLAEIVARSVQFLLSSGWLVVEHGYDQGEQVRQLFVNAGFSAIETKRDLAGLERVTLGQLV